MMIAPAQFQPPPQAAAAASMNRPVAMSTPSTAHSGHSVGVPGGGVGVAGGAGQQPGAPVGALGQTFNTAMYQLSEAERAMQDELTQISEQIVAQSAAHEARRNPAPAPRKRGGGKKGKNKFQKKSGWGNGVGEDELKANLEVDNPRLKRGGVGPRRQQSSLRGAAAVLPPSSAGGGGGGPLFGRRAAQRGGAVAAA
jgi:hypothetical protein